MSAHENGLGMFLHFSIHTTNQADNYQTDFCRFQRERERERTRWGYHSSMGQRERMVLLALPVSIDILPRHTQFNMGYTASERSTYNNSCDNSRLFAHCWIDLLPNATYCQTCYRINSLGETKRCIPLMQLTVKIHVTHYRASDLE